MANETLRHVLTKRRVFRIPSLHTLLHKGEHFAHMTYLGLVTIETQYWYGKVAGVILLISIVSIFIHEGESHADEALSPDAGSPAE